MTTKVFAAGLVALVAFGCSDPPTTSTALNDAAVAPEFTPNFDAASGCVTPRFNAMLVPTAPHTFGGPVTGDLEGTMELVFDEDFPTKIAGVTIFTSGGIANWDITGGILGPLTFQTTFEQRNHMDAPPAFGTVFENLGSHRALTGVAKANLTYKGTFDVLASPAPLADHDYHGVICP